MPKPKSRRKPPAPRPLFIAQLKEEIRRRAQERQARIERGELDLPIHYAPLPTEELFDLLSQLEYRVPSLDLAVPPPEPGLAARLKRSCKALVCKALRWLLIRQVEFNTAALRQGYETARLLGLADRNVGELMAAQTALKLQVRTLAGRLARLEQRTTGEEQAASEVAHVLAADAAPLGEREAADDTVYRAYLPYFKERLAVLVLGCGTGAFLKTLIAEGVSAQGVEPDSELADEARENELPVVCAPAADYLGRLADDSLGAIYLGPTLAARPAQELARLLEVCWTKVRKGGLLLAAASNRSGPPGELLCFLLDSACFTVLDYLFSSPAPPDLPAVILTSSGQPFDRRQYRDYTIVARK